MSKVYRGRGKPPYRHYRKGYSDHSTVVVTPLVVRKHLIRVIGSDGSVNGATHETELHGAICGFCAIAIQGRQPDKVLWDPIKRVLIHTFCLAEWLKSGRKTKFNLP